MAKAIYNVRIRVLTRENLKIQNYMEKAPFQYKVGPIVFQDNLPTAFLNINLTSICSKSPIQKKKKTIQKLLEKKMLKKVVVLQLMKEKEQVTQSK